MGLRPTYDAIDAFAPHRPSTDADAASASHLDFLDGVRGFAALYVVAHHAMLNLPPVASRVDALMRRAFALGHFSVDVFIVLSGFCLMLPVLRRPGHVGLWPFIGRRAVRILPAYYVALLCSLLLIGTVIGQPSGTHWDVSLPVTTRDVALHMMLMHDWSASSALRINHPFWSIAVEWKIYFLFPVLLWLRARTGMTRTAGVALLSGYVGWLVLERTNALNPGPWGSSPYYVGLFALGMLAAELTTSARCRAWAVSAEGVAIFAAATVVLGALALVESSARGPLLPLQLASAPMGAWTGALLVMLHTGALPRLSSALASRPSASLGRMGYSIYLVHAPLVQLVHQYLVAPISWPAACRPMIMVTLGALVTVLVAYPFYRLAERPFHQLSRRL